MAYQLTEEDLDGWEEWDPPLVRAARNPDTAVLEAFIAYYQAKCSRWDRLSKKEQRCLRVYGPNYGVSGAYWGTFETPLTAAIRANSPRKVKILLESGADCNGIKADDLSDYAVRYLRGRDVGLDVSSFGGCPPRAEVLAKAKTKGIENQFQPLTSAELDERRIGFPRFWTEPNVPAQRLRMAVALTSLEVAAQCGSEEILDILHAAGAEDSAWRAPAETEEEGSLLEVSAEASLSKLSVSSPVHQAIAAGQRSMLGKLFTTYNYCPNYRPLVAPTMALPPLSFAIARCDLSKPGVRECISDLLAHPRLAPHLRTPVFEIHPLHFATARHDPELLTWIAASIPGGHATAGRTALGHTLLHIAALPLTGDHTLKGKPAVKRSIHCARTLDTKWLQHFEPSPRHLKWSDSVRTPPGIPNPRKEKPMTEAEQAAQLATIKLLLEWGGFDVRAEDVDGNTALHYLAATSNVGPESLEVLRAMDGGEEVWQNSKNLCGLTPQQIMEE
ncbi:hypothetical protein KEM54_006724 [Ascosphaera aggregata]|nr:hypothetical protein KEM54_006724 [Ascosphaera aggregata]